MFRFFLVLVFLTLLASCGTSRSDVATLYCARKAKCCQIDYSQCYSQTKPRILRSMQATLELYRDLSDHQCGEPSIKRQRLLAMLMTPQPVLSVPDSCTSHDDCPWKYNSDYIKTGHWMCSCPISSRDKAGHCKKKVCVPPAKLGERCAASPLPVKCDWQGWCSMADGDKTGVCVARKKLGAPCRKTAECEETADYIGFCQRRTDSLWGKCAKAPLACGA